VNYFPPQPKNWHNGTTVLYTKYVCNTKNYFPPEPKTNTTPQLYCTLSTYNKYVTPKPISYQNQKTETTAQLEKSSSSSCAASVNTLTVRRLEEHMWITLIFSRIISVMFFTVLLLLMYFISKSFWLSIHVDSWFLKNDWPNLLGLCLFLLNT
jgi:hypothetical protein